jgi:hypothetical protein
LELSPEHQLFGNFDQIFPVFELFHIFEVGAMRKKRLQILLLSIRIAVRAGFTQRKGEILPLSAPYTL